MSETTVRLWMAGGGQSQDRTAAELTTLLDRARTGDVSAFEQVMLRTERTVMLTSRRLLGNVADAEEAAQEVFLRVYKYLKRFDTRRPFEPWLYRLTVNVCNDIASRRAPSPETTDDHQLKSAAADPHDTLDSHEQRRLLQSALRELPEKQRSAVILRDLQGWSTSEVAAALNITEATVRSHVSAARLRMKRFIEKRFRRCL